ncbi:MAG: ABC transporter permease [Clostridiaceae bacterium]|jgi:ABC-type uncharacterized transport system permease subunit|nr:ABC transporter permease [Clostridiaceae bacterium]
MLDRRMTQFNILRGAVAIFFALFVAAIFVFLTSESPLESLRYLLIGPLVSVKNGAVSFNMRNMLEVLAAMIPTIFTGLAVCVMFSANQFNLAGEGCVYVGAFVGGLIGVYWDLPPFIHPLVATLVAGVVCAVIMLIPALAKVILGASEMVTSLMLNYVMLYVSMHFLNFHFANRSRGATMTHDFRESARVFQIVPGTSKLSWGFIAALILTVIMWFFMYRTRWGYSIRMIGINESFALYSGMNVAGMIIVSQMIGGMLSGMGGSLEVLGRYNQFLWLSLPGYGWTGITIAILARNNPGAVPLAAFFLAYLNKGCMLMSTKTHVPSEMIDIIQAAIFLFFAAEQFLSGYRQKIVVKTTREELLKQGNADIENGGE